MLTNVISYYININTEITAAANTKKQGKQQKNKQQVSYYLITNTEIMLITIRTINYRTKFSTSIIHNYSCFLSFSSFPLHRYDKKPLFRYSGCHHYDASAFNVALGVMFSYDTRPYLASASPFVRVKAKPQPDSDAPLAGRGEEDEATNTSSLRDTLSRRPLGVGRKTDRTLGGLETVQRATRSNSTSRAGSKRLGERERERESYSKHIVAINATRRRGSDEGSRSIY